MQFEFAAASFKNQFEMLYEQKIKPDLYPSLYHRAENATKSPHILSIHFRQHYNVVTQGCGSRLSSSRNP